MTGRSLMCIVQENRDVARNIALSDWAKARDELRSDWIALIPADTFIRNDAIVAAIVDGAPVSRVGDAYVLARTAVDGLSAPWFKNGEWLGQPAKDRSDLLHDMFSGPTKTETATEETKRASERAKSDVSQIIAIGIPTLGRVSLPWVSHALRLAPPMVCTATLIVAENHPVAPARQKIVDSVLQMNPRPPYLLFWGDDNLPPPDGLRMLLDTLRKYDAPAVSGLYYMKTYPPEQAIMWRQGHLGPLIAGKDFQLGEIIEVDGSGLDFILFRTEALAKLPPLKFRTVLDWVSDKGMIIQTEDAYFWDRWREVYGKGPLVDTRCRVGHYSMFDGGVY